MSAATPDRERQHPDETVARRWRARLAGRILRCWQALRVVYYEVGQLAGTGGNFDTANAGCRYDQKPVSYLQSQSGRVQELFNEIGHAKTVRL